MIRLFFNSNAPFRAALLRSLLVTSAALPLAVCAGDASLNYRAVNAQANTAIQAPALAKLDRDPELPADRQFLLDTRAAQQTTVEISSSAQSEPALLQSLFFGEALVEQRRHYGNAKSSLQSGDRKSFETSRAMLQDYPLVDYLEYQRLAIDGSLTPRAIARFKEQFGNARLANKLRYQYLQQLAASSQWQPFIEHFYTSTSNKSLRCHYAHALFETGQDAAAMEQARSLWLTPASMPDACDPVFGQYREREENFAGMASERFDGAYRAGEITLARYLAKFLEDDRQAIASQLIEAYGNATQLGKNWQQRIEILNRAFADAASRRQVLAMWIRKLSRQDLDAAIGLVNKKLVRRDGTGLPAEQAKILLAELQPYLLTRFALVDYNRLPTVYRKLGKPTDLKSLEWLLRAQIARADWDEIPDLVDALPESARASERWQYWRLRARQLDDSLDEQGRRELEALSANASFYGFAAARHTGNVFRLEPESYALSGADLQALSENPNLRRAVEHFAQGEIDEANSAWAAGLRQTDSENWLKAAYLASALGWHQQAILTAARADAWRHYALRFPQVAQDHFAAQALRYNQPPEWFYATARQESALASHSRSSAGAIGLMQLLPSTAKQVARSLDREYSREQLFQPGYSIDLGSHYLHQLYEQFGNRALGSAAYNAGPHRVTAWLRNLKKPIPLDAWIETIRFSETRQYVQNILSFGLIHSAIHSDLAAGDSLAQEPSMLRPWPAFSFLADKELIVRPYEQQVRQARRQ